MSYRTTVKFNLVGPTVNTPQTGYNTVQEQTTNSSGNALVSQMLLFSGFLFCVILVAVFLAKLPERRKDRCGFRIKKPTRSKLFSVLACLFLAGSFGFSLAIHSSNNNPTSAATFNFNVPETLEISGKAGDFAYGCETLTLNTATDYGYSIYASAINTTNFSTADGSSFIQVIPAGGALTSNSWGMIHKGAEVTKSGDWLPVPKYIDGVSDGVLVAKYDDETVAGQETTICYGFLTSTEMTPGIYSAVIDFRVKIDERTPKAILGTNGNLNFVFDQNTYTVGGKYTDNLGETTIANVYSVPKNAATVHDIDASDDDEIDFNHNNSITSVNFDEAFYDFKPISTGYWFWHDDNLESVTNAKNLNISKVNNLSGMFAYAGTDIDELSFSGLGEWDTSSVTDMSHMFENAGQDASSFTIDNLSGWNTKNVTDVEYMFRKAGIGTLNLSGWDLHNITDMHWMFHSTGGNASSLSIDLSNWNISGATILRGMFWDTGENAVSLSLNLTGWNTENVEDMSYMFDATGKYAESFTITGIADLNTSNVTDMRSMFNGAGRDADYEIDLRGWNVDKVTSYSGFNDYVTDKVIAPIWVH